MFQFKQWLVFLFLSVLAVNILALEKTSEIPDSLAKWYKPENKRQVWLHTMFGMRRELQAVQEYSAQGDIKGIKKWSTKLIKHYRSLSEMVPEWSEEIEPDIASDLEKAVAQESFIEIKSLTKKLSKNCSSCHKDYSLLARLRYRTADFSQLEVVEEGTQVKFKDFKIQLIKTLNRVKIYVADDHWDLADLEVSKLESKLNDYGELCVTCHKDNEPRERILGSSTQAGLLKLKQAIAIKDFKLTGKNLGSTAVDVCARCHGVHRTLSEIRGQLFGSNSDR